MRAHRCRCLIWAGPWLLPGLLAVGVASGQRSAAASELLLAVDEAACAGYGDSTELADFLASDEAQGAAAAPVAPAEPADQGGAAPVAPAEPATREGAAAPVAPAEPAPAAEAAAPATPGTYARACSTNPQCPKKSYCAKPLGDCKGKGECKVKPQICPDIYKPVCGCDGKTYPNDCWAAAAGVNVKADGQCEKAVKCKTNKQCGKLQFCAKPDGKCDDEGVCAPRPINVFCIKADPVCGCDNKTYDSRCFAHRAGVDVKHAGKCE